MGFHLVGLGCDDDDVCTLQRNIVMYTGRYTMSPSSLKSLV